MVLFLAKAEWSVANARLATAVTTVHILSIINGKGKGD
jgi:hypothetical protein